MEADPSRTAAGWIRPRRHLNAREREGPSPPAPHGLCLVARADDGEGEEGWELGFGWEEGLTRSPAGTTRSEAIFLVPHSVTN
jgi:hypothetical protein